MSKLLYVGTHGTDDATQASMPFVAAVGALNRGYEPSIVLMGEAVYLLKGNVADSVHGVGYLPLRRLLDEIIEAKVSVHVGISCAKAREVTESDFAGMNAQFATASDLADLILANDGVISF